MFGCSPVSGPAAQTLSLDELVMDLSLSGPEDLASGQSSPRPGLFGRDAGYSTDDGPAEAVVSVGGASSQNQWARLPTAEVELCQTVPVDHEHTEATLDEKQGAQGAYPEEERMLGSEKQAQGAET